MVAPGGMILISKSTKTPSPISGYLNFGYQAKGKASEFQYGAGVDVLFFDYFDPFIEFWGRRRSFGEDPFGDHPPSYISFGFKWIGTGLSADLCVDFLVLGKREYDFHDFFPKDSAAAREAHVAPGWGERPTWAINFSMAYSYDFYNMRPVTNKAMIIGRVVDKVTQEGLDAVITAPGARRLVSDPITGGYEIKVNPGKVNLVVSKKGYKDVVKVVDISRAQRIIVDVQMEPKVKHAIVTGKIIDKWSTEPIEDVEVTICRGEKTRLLTAATPGTMVKALKGKLYKLNPETGAWELVRDTIRDEDITTVMNGKVYKLDIVTGEWKEVKGETPGISEGDITSVIDGKLHKLNPITGEWEEVKGEVKFEDVVSEEDITKEIDGELYKLNVVTGKWEKVVVPVEEPEWAADTVTLTQQKGLYRLDLIPAGTHLLKVKKKGYIPQVSPVVCKPNETSVVNFELFAKRIVLRGVHFEFDKATLLVDSYPILERVYKFLKENPDLKVEIGGHTDWIASEEYNLELSFKRANAVRNYLIMHGIDPDRLTVKGYGESQPIADNTTEEGRALNRRIELKILEGGEGIDIEEWERKKEE
jgi:outer membrane protein OmpA-like peptidoglycan-associated protein